MLTFLLQAHPRIPKYYTQLAYAIHYCATNIGKFISILYICLNTSANISAAKTFGLQTASLHMCVLSVDTGRYVVMENLDDCNQVHFSRNSEDEAYSCLVKTKGNLCFAEVPNILLQNVGQIFHISSMLIESKVELNFLGLLQF